MPAYNEGERLARTLGELASADRASFTVFLVDDGSAPPIDEEAVSAAAGGVRVVLARHVVNLGQGAAIETARRLSLDPRWAPEGGSFDAWVTMDADGQHGADDVLALAQAIQGGADVALGDRFAGGSNVPRARRALLVLARTFERLTTGLRLSDAHNGLRAFSRRAVERMHIRRNRMAHATELTRRIAGERQRLRVVEVPVSVRYSDESLAKGQSATGAIAIVVDLFQGFLFGK
jgi:glycosyltransferase involved in cell wall biosynthesis